MNADTTKWMNPALVKPALLAAFTKLDLRVQWRNPMVFVVWVGSASPPRWR